MSGHPRRCNGCRGSGYMDGPPIPETINGHNVDYATVTPCTHPFWHDDTGWDPYYEDPLAADHPKAKAAFDRGYAQGLAELDQLRNPAPAGRARQADAS